MSDGMDPVILSEMKALANDPRLAELGSYVPPLSLLGAFGAERDEVAHSRALALLLNPARHRNAGIALGALVREVARRSGLDGQVASALKKACRVPWARVAVHTERMCIDIVVEIATSRGEAVVLGIENKIDADEQPAQLARYQAALARAYPGRTAVLAFLTPTGRDPTTALEGAAVPVVALDYGAALSALGEARERAPSGSRDERVLREFEDHVREDILGEREDEAKALARGLWRTHARALRFALEHRPRLSDVREEYVRLLADRYPDAYFEYYPAGRTNLREIKMNLGSWDELGFPFTFMLETNGRNGEPRVRALIWRESFEEHAGSLAAWARRANAASGEPTIDEGFPRIRGWDWHKIFREEDYPEEVGLEEDAFDAETARAAFDAVVELVELLRPRVENA